MLFRSLHVPAPPHRPRYPQPTPDSPQGGPAYRFHVARPRWRASGRVLVGGKAITLRAVRGVGERGHQRPVVNDLSLTQPIQALLFHGWTWTPPRAASDSASAPVQDPQVPVALVALLHDRRPDLLRWLRGCAPASAQPRPASASAARAEDFPAVSNPMLRTASSAARGLCAALAPGHLHAHPCPPTPPLLVF